jgi:hypothetical protein
MDSPFEFEATFAQRMMQLDIFEHSRDVVLRNAVIDALRTRNTGACARGGGACC